VVTVFRGIANLKIPIYRSRIQTIQLKAAVDLRIVMDILLKSISLVLP